MTEKTHVVMTLDRSASMADCREATVASVNKYLEEAKADANLKLAGFELMIFDSKSIDSVRDGTMDEIKALEYNDFVPRENTPLYDAIGRGIDTLDAKLKAAGTTKAVLVIVTDGEENWSKKYTLDAIKELIASREAQGWMVIFLGAGLDAAKQGAKLGVRAAYTASFGKDAAAMAMVARSLSTSNAAYAAMAEGAATMDFMEQSGFSDKERSLMGDDTAGNWLKDLKPLDPNTAKTGFAAAKVAAKEKKDSFADKAKDQWGS